MLGDGFQALALNGAADRVQQFDHSTFMPSFAALKTTTFDDRVDIVFEDDFYTSLRNTKLQNLEDEVTGYEAIDSDTENFGPTLSNKRNKKSKTPATPQ